MVEEETKQIETKPYLKHTKTQNLGGKEVSVNQNIDFFHHQADKS